MSFPLYFLLSDHKVAKGFRSSEENTPIGQIARKDIHAILSAAEASPQLVYPQDEMKTRKGTEEVFFKSQILLHNANVEQH